MVNDRLYHANMIVQFVLNNGKNTSNLNDCVDNDKQSFKYVKMIFK